MKTKLTLTIQPTLIDLAKKYAQQNHTSLSTIFENYLKTLVAKEKINETSVSEKYAGILKNTVYTTMSDEDLKKEYHQSRISK